MRRGDHVQAAFAEQPTDSVEGANALPSWPVFAPRLARRGNGGGQGGRHSIHRQCARRAGHDQFVRL